MAGGLQSAAVRVVDDVLFVRPQSSVLSERTQPPHPSGPATSKHASLNISAAAAGPAGRGLPRGQSAARAVMAATSAARDPASH